MTTLNKPSFMSLPVKGEVVQSCTMKEQRPIQELVPLFQALLDDPTLHSFGWRQYTPYFNDGETCYFDTQTVWFRTQADVEAEQAKKNHGCRCTHEENEDDYWDADDLAVTGYTPHPTLGGINKTWDRTVQAYVEEPYVGPDEARYRRCRAAAEAVEGGSFDNALLKEFGDHAEITISREGVTIDFYEHD